MNGSQVWIPVASGVPLRWLLHVHSSLKSMSFSAEPGLRDSRPGALSFFYSFLSALQVHMALLPRISSAVFRDVGAAVFARHVLVSAFDLHWRVTEDAVCWRDFPVRHPHSTSTFNSLQTALCDVLGSAFFVRSHRSVIVTGSVPARKTSRMVRRLLVKCRPAPRRRCVSPKVNAVGKVHVHGKFPSIVDTCFRARDTSGWSVSAHKIQFLLGLKWTFL
jgi:hypothetical protein